jgi:hypothetical protein
MATMQQVGVPVRSLTRRPGVRAGATVALAVAVAVVAVVAGVGLLYELRGVGLLDVGPRVAGALPLERLAGGAAQPLGRMAFAWVPVGIVAGLALRTAGFRSRAARGTTVGIVAAVLLMAVGAISDAVTSSSPVAGHIGPQLSLAGTWVAAALMAAGSLLVGARRVNQPR